MQLLFYELLEPAMAFDEPLLICSDLTDFHSCGRSAETEAAKEKFLQFHNAACIRIQQLEKRPWVPHVQPQHFEVVANGLRADLLLKHREGDSAAANIVVSDLVKQGPQLLKMLLLRQSQEKAAYWRRS